MVFEVCADDVGGAMVGLAGLRFSPPEPVLSLLSCAPRGRRRVTTAPSQPPLPTW